MFDLSLLSHFIAVARTRSFTRAAEMLNTSQPVISRSIRRVEEHVGAPLFERTTRQVKLTPAGDAFLAEAMAMVDRLSVATDNARRISRGGEAKLRIGICPSADPETARIALGFNAFRSRWPQADVKLTTRMRNVQAQALRTSEIDIGIMLMSRTDCEGIEWRVIARDPLVAVVPKAWGLRGTSVALHALRDRPWIMPHPDISPDMHHVQMELCRSAGFEPRVVAYSEDALTARMMLAFGLGAAFVYHHGVRGQEDHAQFMAIEGIPDLFFSETVVAWAAGSTSALVSDFVQCVAEGAPSLSPLN